MVDMPRPYYEPQSIAPILQEGLRQRLPYLQRPMGGIQAALPALGAMAEAGFGALKERQKKQSLLEAQNVYSDYLSKLDAGTATDRDHRIGFKAAFSLGLTPPDLAQKQLQRSQIEENLASSRLKSSTADLYARGGAAPGPGGPEIINQGGREFMVKRGLKGEKSYLPLAPAAGDKPVPAETAKTSSLAQAGIRAIGQIRGIVNDPATKGKLFSPSAIAGGFGGETLAKISGDTQTQILQQQIAEAGDAISRLRSGAAITVVEEKRYGNLLKGRFKTSEAYENALKTVETFLKRVDDDLKIGRRKIGSVEPESEPQGLSQQKPSSFSLLDKYGAP